MGCYKINTFYSLNYPAFGSVMNQRTYTAPSTDYKYGFNGMEKDNETYGSGNALDFGARIYDSRLGRWMSVDAMTSSKSGKSPYIGIGNAPIIYVDPDGKDEYITFTIIDKRTGKTTIQISEPISDNFSKQEEFAEGSDGFHYAFYNTFTNVEITIEKDGSKAYRNTGTVLGKEPVYTRHPIVQGVGQIPVIEEGSGDAALPGGVHLSSENGGVSPTKTKTKDPQADITEADLLLAAAGGVKGGKAPANMNAVNKASGLAEVVAEEVNNVSDENAKKKKEEEIQEANKKKKEKEETDDKCNCDNCKKKDGTSGT